MGGPGLGGAVVAEKLAFPVTKLLLQLNNADEDDLCKGEPSWALQPLARCIEMDTSVDQSQYISTWAANTKCFVDMTPLAFLRERQHKVAFTVPPDVMLIAPLAITAACGGAELKAFREVLHYDTMMLAFSQSGQYEAAGTMWMCEVTTDPVVDTLSVSQVESAMAAFSKDAFRQSSTHAPNRRYSFDGALPVHVVDLRVAQRRAAGPAASGADTGVLMAQLLPLLAGGALVVGWYAQMQEALLTRYRCSNCSKPAYPYAVFGEHPRDGCRSRRGLDTPASAQPHVAHHPRGRSCWRTLRRRWRAKLRCSRWRALLQPLARFSDVFFFGVCFFFVVLRRFSEILRVVRSSSGLFRSFSVRVCGRAQGCGLAWWHTRFFAPQARLRGDPLYTAEKQRDLDLSFTHASKTWPGTCLERVPSKCASHRSVLVSGGRRRSRSHWRAGPKACMFPKSDQSLPKPRHGETNTRTDPYTTAVITQARKCTFFCWPAARHYGSWHWRRRRLSPRPFIPRRKKNRFCAASGCTSWRRSVLSWKPGEEQLVYTRIRKLQHISN